MLSFHLALSTYSIQLTLLFFSFNNPVPASSLESNDYTHTHTHTLSDTVSPHVLPTSVVHLAAADAEEAANSLSSSFTSS